MQKYLIAYILSFIITTLTIIYLLKLPQFITQNNELVYEYYYGKNRILNISLDFIFILLYLIIAFSLCYFFDIKNNAGQLIVVIITTFVLTLSAMIYFTSYPMSPSFFSKWFHIIGYKSILYDIILIALVFIIMKQIYYFINSFLYI